jgi:hypothetical protein
VLLTDGDHFLGGIARPDQSPVPVQKDAVLQLTLGFLDAYLTDDAVVKTWLSSIVDQIGGCAMLFKSK